LKLVLKELILVNKIGGKNRMSRIILKKILIAGVVNYISKFLKNSRGGIITTEYLINFCYKLIVIIHTKRGCT